MSVIMQASSSTTGALVTWLMASPDWAGTSFPGPGTAVDVAVAAAADASTPDGILTVVSGLLLVPATEIRTTSADGKSIDHDFPLPSVLTTDATATSLFSFATASGRRYYLSGFVLGTTGSGAGDWAYELKGVFDNVAGALTQRVATPVNELYETTTSATLSVAVSGTNIAVSIVGVAATSIRWTGRIFLHEAIF